MGEQLAPCPFCGGESQISHNPHADDWTVWCTQCTAEKVVIQSDKQAAIEAWNRREPSPLLARCREVLEALHHRRLEVDKYYENSHLCRMTDALIADLPK